MHVAACVCLLFAILPNTGKRVSEEAWAREIAVHFLTSALNLNEDEALSVATGAFRRRLDPAETRNSARGLRNIVFDVVWEAKQADRIAYPSVQRTVMAPTEDKARLTGELLIGRGTEIRKLGEFSIIVHKDA